MRASRIILLVSAAVLVLAGTTSLSFAFHSGGVAECSGCHSMHEAPATSPSLLIARDQSSTCLSCHQHTGDTGPSSYHISTALADMPTGTPPLQRTPGGDFGWVKKTYTYVLRGTTTTEAGDTHGHNVVALDFDYFADATNTTSPGGSFPAAQLSCVSCHDPHGKYRRLNDGTITTAGAPIRSSGSYNNNANPPAGEAVGVYRLLAGAGYDRDGTAPVVFTGNPAAVVPSTYNRNESDSTGASLIQTRTAYGAATTGGHVGWGDWCGTCHAAMHSTTGNVHPVDENLNGLKTIYDQYRGSGNMTGTNPTAYLSLVPFAEVNVGSTLNDLYTQLQGHAKTDNTALAGPSVTDQVTCLSCHRAHASGWSSMLRWNMESELILVAGTWGGTDAGTVTGAATQPNDVKIAQGRTQAETKAAYYNYPASTFAVYQRVLCNKCHAKD